MSFFLFKKEERPLTCRRVNTRPNMLEAKRSTTESLGEASERGAEHGRTR